MRCQLSTAIEALVRGRYLKAAAAVSETRSFVLAENGLQLQRNWLRVYRQHFLRQAEVVAEVDSLEAPSSDEISKWKGGGNFCLMKTFDPQSPPNVDAEFKIHFGGKEEKHRITVDETTTLDVLTLLPLDPDREEKNSKKWTFRYHDWLRSRRRWWKSYFFNPGSVNVVERDARTEVPRAQIESVFEAQNFNLSNNLDLESVRVLDRSEIPTCCCPSTAKCVMTRGSVSAGTLSLMLDSVRNRIFAPRGAVYHPRIAIHRDLAPFQVALCVSEISTLDPPTRTSLSEFKRYLTALLQKENVIVWDLEGELSEETDFFNEYEAADVHGIPYLVVVTPQSLENGIVNVRDRETSWFEQIHAAYLTQRFVRCFQDRFVRDTWTQICQMQE